ncbi:hypothetical protein lerEdw1_010056 [Lerista edwardsae]|nr:hypothetical protein lerEdw1_010056 [Lerista edwardsae]
MRTFIRCGGALAEDSDSRSPLDGPLDGEASSRSLTGASDKAQAGTRQLLFSSALPAHLPLKLSSSSLWQHRCSRRLLRNPVHLTMHALCFPQAVVMGLSGPSSKPRVFFLLALLSILLILSYTLQRMLSEVTVFRGCHEHTTQDAAETGPVPCPHFLGDGTCQADEGVSCQTRMRQRKQDQEVKAILARLDQMMPRVTFTDIKTTTSAKHSRATLLNPRRSYCVGDHLLVRLDLYDYLGKRKAYGGDFLRVRIHSPHLKAGAAGHITDYRNGTYLVNFTLFWEGTASVSLLLIHPSEGVSALWAARKKGFDKIAFTGQFQGATGSVSTKCGFNISTSAELCEYRDERDQEVFYCVKPKSVPCEAFVFLKSNNEPVSYLTALEQRLLRASNIGVVIPVPFGDICVLTCNRSATTPGGKCRIGLGLPPVPSGHALRNAWHPEFCSVSDFNTPDKIRACLKGKMIYLMGDSTLRQWIYCLTAKLPTLKFFNHHDSGAFPTHVAMDVESNIFVQWKKHGHPFVTAKFYLVKDDRYIASEIDRLAGDNDTAVVVTLGQHFRPFPMDLFVRRLLNVRGAIQRLLLRSPSTRVVVKTENGREMTADVERFGDANGYSQYLVTRDVFKDLNVGFIDAWDMNIAYAANDVHPPFHMVFNQVIMFLTYIC